MPDIIFALLNIQQKLKLKKHALQSQVGQTKVLPALPLVLADTRPLPLVLLLCLASLACCWLTGPFSGLFLLSNQKKKFPLFLCSSQMMKKQAQHIKLLL